ncbi:MAG: NTP transferase domain-containing protein [Chitinispirillales bacterium]|jgi:mannose-1-phosphate guanylyltransferase/mannose-6-phosphate isomerase|nr:NTP transferase domain-containing protein [Chitinispirillales bacterium]
MQTIPIILAGGIGERFWPMSRSGSPKQLHAIGSDRCMLEETLARMRACCPNSVAPVIVTGAGIAKKVADALKLSDANIRIIGGAAAGALTGTGASVDIIAEPQGKNTAPAVALAAAYAAAKYGDAVMAVVSADHAISPPEAFEQALARAAEIAENRGGLVVFGIKPSRPETGYGYIETGERLTAGAGGCEAVEVRRFVEKPNPADAAAFMESGGFLWNSGMFVWKASAILDEFRKHMPGLRAQAEAAASKGFTKEAIGEFYSVCRKESIDYGIMEKAEAVSVVKGGFFWDDLGSWESRNRVYGRDDRGNTVNGPLVYESECADSLVINKSPHAVAAIGLKNVALVAVGDAILAIDRSRLPDLKKYLSEIKASGKFPQELF